AALVGDARGEQACGQPARLQDHDFAVLGKAVLEEHLRDLRGFPRTRRRLEDQAGLGFQGLDDGGFQFVDGKCGRQVGRFWVGAGWTIYKATASFPVRSWSSRDALSNVARC